VPTPALAEPMDGDYSTDDSMDTTASTEDATHNIGPHTARCIVNGVGVDFVVSTASLQSLFHQGIGSRRGWMDVCGTGLKGSGTSSTLQGFGMLG
jgi:hypothetical protein